MQINRLLFAAKGKKTWLCSVLVVNEERRADRPNLISQAQFGAKCYND